MTRVGFIGLGLMGGTMSRILLSNGFSVTGFDIDPGRVADFVKLGGRGADSPAEVAASSDILCSSLPNGKILREVYLGSGRALASLARGSVIVDFSTTEPAAIKDLCEAAALVGVHAVDAPVSGGPADIQRQELVILFGGTDEAFAAAEPVLQTLSGGRIHRIGPAGSARVVKLVNNTMALGNLIVAAEAFVMGVKAGIDPKVLLEVLSNSGGRSHHLMKRFPHALKRDFAARFSMNMGIKDVRLALALAEQVASPMPVAGMFSQLYAAAAAEGHGEEDMVAILCLFEKWAGVEADARDTQEV